LKTGHSSFVQNQKFKNKNKNKNLVILKEQKLTYNTFLSLKWSKSYVGVETNNLGRFEEIDQQKEDLSNFAFGGRLMSIF
jgi:hypothetical protein